VDIGPGVDPNDEALAAFLRGQAQNDRRLRAIGRIAEASGQLDWALRRAFCALLGSKYGAILAGGQSTVTLINQCKAILRRHREITDADKNALEAILNDCAEVNGRRKLIHDVWGYGPGGATTLLRSSQNHGHEVLATPITVEEIEGIGVKYADCERRLAAAVDDAFGYPTAQLEAQLRWEEYVATMPKAELEALLRRSAAAQAAGAGPTLADLVRQEQEQVAAGQAVPCGKVCDDGCHGPLRCVRAEHPHDPDADMGTDELGRPRAKGNVSPHYGYGTDDRAVQWTCFPREHDGLTDEQRAAKRAAD
jgi:hypothetical protein